MPLKVLHAADANAAVAVLAVQLRRWRDRNVTILLTSYGLKNTPGKNDIIREALAAANEGTLLVVRLDGSDIPVGARDAPLEFRVDSLQITADELRSRANLGVAFLVAIMILSVIGA